MAQRNISKAEHGNMRVQITCPCCGSRCKVTASRKMTDRLRYSSIQCLNASCSWSGVASTEVIKTISPPSPLHQNPALVPPQMTADEIIEQHGGSSQKNLL